MAEEKPVFIESSYIEKYTPEQVNYVRLITGIEHPDAVVLRRVISERLQEESGGSTP